MRGGGEGGQGWWRWMEQRCEAQTSRGPAPTFGESHHWCLESKQKERLSLSCCGRKGSGCCSPRTPGYLTMLGPLPPGMQVLHVLFRSRSYERNHNLKLQLPKFNFIFALNPFYNISYCVCSNMSSPLEYSDSRSFKSLRARVRFSSRCCRWRFSSFRVWMVSWSS